MAMQLTAPLHGDFISGPGMVIPLADQTATTASQQFVGSGGRLILAKWVSAIVMLKTFVVGTGTVYPIFALETADDTGFATNKRRVAGWQPLLQEAVAAIPGTNPIMSFFMEGPNPDGGKNWIRIAVTFNGTSSGTFDTIITGA
jgi:hypothetical protein